MSGNEYKFVTRWQVESTIEEVYEILMDAEGLARWWPSGYLEVKQLDSGDSEGVGKHVRLYTKGWLPYTLRWEFRTTETNRPFGFTLKAWGDFEGIGIWEFEQDGVWVDIYFHWEILAQKPLLRYLSFLMKPVFAANHRWAMKRVKEV